MKGVFPPMIDQAKGKKGLLCINLLLDDPTGQSDPGDLVAWALGSWPLASIRRTAAVYCNLLIKINIAQPGYIGKYSPAAYVVKLAIM